MKKYLTISFLTLLSFQCKNAPEEVEIVHVDTTETKQIMPENEDYALAEFTIEGMTCAMGCAKTIETNLSKTEGVAHAAVDFDSKTARVKFDPTVLDLDDIESAVKASGDMYQAVNIKRVSDFNSNESHKTACKMACCKGKTDAKSCKADCEKPCCKDKAKEEAKACAADCKKECCKTKSS